MFNLCTCLSEKSVDHISLYLIRYARLSMLIIKNCFIHRHLIPQMHLIFHMGTNRNVPIDHYSHILLGIIITTNNKNIISRYDLIVVTCNLYTVGIIYLLSLLVTISCGNKQIRQGSRPTKNEGSGQYRKI